MANLTDIPQVKALIEKGKADGILNSYEIDMVLESSLQIGMDDILSFYELLSEENITVVDYKF
ncbi:MAG: hypothetical protein KIG53_07980 [Oscillospiraceae bacterium]|nr:hypothetical protein [Oscillospiraceae bacterium]